MTARVVDAAIVLLIASVFLILSVGGIDVELGPLRLRVHDWARPAILLAVALVLRSAWRPKRVPLTLGPVASYIATRGMIALLVACVGVYVHDQVRVAGGLDSYGYFSAAALIASGRLSEPQPLAAVLPFEDAIDAAAPLGQIGAADGRSSVPRFPVGFPLLMAALLVFGPSGPFYAPLLTACMALGCAYLIGRDAGDQTTGLFAATLVAVDPLFAAYATQPMSDVPATCWLLAAVWLEPALAAPRLRQSRLHSQAAGWSWQGIAAGMCAGMAMLTRPALLPAIIVLVLVAAARTPRRLPRAMSAIVLAFIAIQAVLNLKLYGSPTASGYGSASHMFELSPVRLAANLANFGKWLTYSHTPLFWLLWPAALLILRRQRSAWQVSAIAAAAAAPYMFYLVFDDWDSSRFLLPSITLVLILFACALGEVTRRMPAARPIVLFAIALLCAAASYRFLQAEGLGRNATLEAKYPLVGEWFRQHTSERAVVLAGLHSGTIRLYGSRQTIRWDRIPETALAATLVRLVEAGYEPYLALDLPTEPPLFEARFRAQSVDAQQVARVRVVNIYRLVSAH